MSRSHAVYHSNERLSHCNQVICFHSIKQILFSTGNDIRPICANRWADPRQLSIRAHSSRGSKEKSAGGARGTLQAAWLWSEAPNGHNHSPQTQRTPPEVPIVLPTSFPTAATAPLWNLRHSPGETHITKWIINIIGSLKGWKRY